MNIDIERVKLFTQEMADAVISKFVDDDRVVTYEGKGDDDVDYAFLAAMIVGLPSALRSVFTGSKFSVSETLELFVEIANDIYESLEDVKEESK